MVTCIYCGKEAITVHGDERRCPHCGKYFRKTEEEQEEIDKFRDDLKEIFEKERRTDG